MACVLRSARCVPNSRSASMAFVPFSRRLSNHSAPPPPQRHPSSSPSSELAALRAELAAAQLRIAELQLSSLPTHAALLRCLEETDRAAHKAATELRYTALALRCHYDLLETEWRRLLAVAPSNEETTEADGIRRAAIEAGTREMVRRSIGFRVEKVSAEPAAINAAFTRQGN